MIQRIPQFLLPQTGQTTVYRTGDDGTFQAGRKWTNRFVDNGNGTVFDRATGLTWVKQPAIIIPGAVGVHTTNQVQVARGNWANSTAYAAADIIYDDWDGTGWYICAIAHTSSATATFMEDYAANPTYWRYTVWSGSADNLTTPMSLTWYDAIDNCLALEYAGRTDWRLPNVRELLSLVDHSIATGARINSTAFPNCMTSIYSYWTSTIFANITTRATHVNFNAATAGISSQTTKTSLWYVRPVRGGRTL